MNGRWPSQCYGADSSGRRRVSGERGVWRGVWRGCGGEWIARSSGVFARRQETLEAAGPEGWGARSEREQERFGMTGKGGRPALPAIKNRMTGQSETAVHASELPARHHRADNSRLPSAGQPLVE